MKAIMCTKYGPPDVLQLVEVEKPTPQDHQVLVRVRAASVNTADLTFTGPLGRLFEGLRKPRDPRTGRDVAGQVEAVGNGVTQFHPGDEVFGACGGSFAEYAVARETSLVLKPSNISYEEAAAVPVAAITALQGLRDKGHIQPGQKVVINGASGGVGTYAVQIAKVLGAEVTAVCSTGNLDTARSIGADHVIDYTHADFTRNGQLYDVIFAVNGYHPILEYRRVLNPQGIYVMVGASHTHLFPALLQTALLGPILSRRGGQTYWFMGIAKINTQDLSILKELLEAGKITSVIDRRYQLSETAEALKYLAAGHAHSKVVITVA